MNFALNTFLILLLIAPGIAFRSAYSFGPLTKKFSQYSTLYDFTWTVIPGVLFQLLASILISKFDFFGDQEVSFLSLGHILFNTPCVAPIGDKDISCAAKEFSRIGENLTLIVRYNLGVIAFGGIVGFSLRKTIRCLNLDHRFQWMRFDNEWFYLLRGEFIFFRERYPKISKKIRTLIRKKEKRRLRFLKKRILTARRLKLNDLTIEPQYIWKRYYSYLENLELMEAIIKEGRSLEGNQEFYESLKKMEPYIKRSVMAREKLRNKAKLRRQNKVKYRLIGCFKHLIFSFKKPVRSERLAGCLITALVKGQDKQGYVYKGFIDSFYLTKEGHLESIIISKPKKKNVIISGNDNTLDVDDFEKIADDIVILKNSEVINLFVTAIEWPKEKFKWIDE